MKHGKLRLVDATDYRAWLRHVGQGVASVGAEGADAVLAEMGLQARRETPRRGRAAAGGR